MLNTADSMDVLMILAELSDRALSYSMNEDVVDNNPELLDFARTTYHAVNEVVEKIERPYR